LYDEIEKACGGLFQDRALEGAFPKDAPSNKPDRTETERDNPDVTVPLLAPIVKAKRAFLGQLPNVRVPKPPLSETDDSDIVMARIEKQERVLKGIWNFSNMTRRMSNVGLFCTVYGTAVGIVWPDFDRELPKILVRAPRGFYPQEKDDDGYELYSAIFYAKKRGAQIAAEFGKKQYATVDKVEVLQYFDDKEITTVTTDGTLLKRIPHKLGFCPVVSIPNIGWGDSPFGESEIAPALKLLKEINNAYAIQLAIADHVMQQPLVLPAGSEHSWPDDIPAGPNDTIELGPEAGNTPAYRLPPMSSPFDFTRLIQDLHQQINDVADSPAALQSKWDNSGTVTGAAVTSLLGPVQLRLGHSLNTIHCAVQILNRMCFQMLESMFPGKHTVYGTSGKKSFTEQFDIKEFMGWYESEVSLLPGQFFDQQSQFVMTLQGVQNKMVSKETAMMYLPIVADVAAEKKQIAKETQEDLQQAMAAQQIAAGPTTQNPPMGEPGATNYALNKGYMGETPPAPVPGGMELPKTGQPEPGAGTTPNTSVNDVMTQFVDLIRSVPNIKGSVYLVGELLDPAMVSMSIDNPSRQPRAELDITEALDKQTLLNYVKANEPNVHGNIVFHAVTGPPAEPFVTIIENGKPSSGYDVQGAPNAQGAETQQAPAPSDITGLLGGGGPPMAQAGQEAQGGTTP
jgi:hypothetical protein